MNDGFRDPWALERARWYMVLGSMALAIVLVLLFWATSFGPWGGWILAVGLNGIIAAHIVRHRDVFLAKLLLFGIVAGFAELPSDYFSVGMKDVLVYPDVGPFIWTSPAYMPFGYSVLMVQFGWLARWFYRRWGMSRAVLLAGLLGAVNVPFYEYFAKGAGFWYYQNTGMLFDTVPPFIIFGEVAFVAVLPPIVKRLERSGWAAPVTWGLVEGVIMYVAWAVGFRLLQ